MAIVLYIENDPDNVLFVKRALEARGHHCLWANTGCIGLALAEAQIPDVILLDLNLPDMDGHEVARRLRANPWGRLFCVPVIALTANTLRGAAENALAAGCDMYLSKPIDIRELWAQVDAAAENCAQRSYREWNR